MSAPAAPRDVAVGDALEPFTIELTLQRLVMEAAANRDFAAIHYDRDAAVASGAPGVYMNTTFIETLFEATLRGWAGLDARIAVIEFTMLDFNCVGDEVSGCGAVTATREEGGELVVDLDLWVQTRHGRTVKGSAVVIFPAVSVSGGVGRDHVPRGQRP